MYGGFREGLPRLVVWSSGLDVRSVVFIVWRSIVVANRVGPGQSGDRAHKPSASTEAVAVPAVGVTKDSASSPADSGYYPMLG